ncbi:MAG: ComEC/Rec2 family competence protein [Bdellovibrionales bacterium]
MSFYLKKFGLLHMIVVSGAHLLFLEKLIITLGLRAKIFVYPLMILFCLVTSLQAPVLRALVAIFLNDVNDRFHLFWRPVQITWLSGIFLWLLFPDWIHSFSFLLSWACALALALMAGQSAFKKQLFLYLFLGLFLLPLQTSHPISILLNLLFAPLIGFLLFPTSLFAFFIPAFTQIPDTLWAVLFRILEWLHQGVESVSLQYPISLLTLWAVLWLTHLLLEIWRQPR